MITTVGFILASVPWGAGDAPLVAVLAALLLLSALFSGSETALFSLTGAQRLSLERRRGVIGRAAGHLLHDPQMLLITLMFGNMTANVTYFVISSALVLKLDPIADAVWVAVGTFGPLLGIIVFGEVLPKMVANLSPERWVRVVAVPMDAMHRVIGPLRLVLRSGVIAPLGRLIAPHHAPPALSDDELESLVRVSERRGVIDRTEEQMLRRVVALSRLKVRDVMVPRVDIIAWDVEDGEAALDAMIREQRVTKVPVCRGDLDHIQGVIFARQYLLARRHRGGAPIDRVIRNVTFVPEIQRVDQLLEQFRRRGTHLAIAVDEYGGTAGLVTLKDIVERLMGELDFEPDDNTEDSPGEALPTAERLDEARWRVSGRLAVHDWGQMFGRQQLPERVATVGGLATALLGSIPSPGDRARLGNLVIEVERVDRGRVESVVLSLDESGGEA